MVSLQEGRLQFQWQDLNLARVNPFLAEERGRITGGVTGAFKATLLDQKRLRFRGSNKGNLVWKQGTSSLSFPGVSLDLKGDEKGIEGRWAVEMAPRGRLTGSLTMPVPAALARPDSGRLESSWEAIDMAQFKPFLGKGTDLTGSLKGHLDGRIQGEKLTAAGEARMEGGRFSWRQRGRRVEAAIPEARLRLVWQGNTLSGQGAVDLAERGRARASFVLPIPAALPVNVQPSEALRMEAQGRLYEKGILSALFPGVVEETRGLVEFDMEASGSWQEPLWRGQARLSGAGAYVPAAGLRLDDAKATVDWFGDRVDLASLSIRSGDGVLTGRGKVWFRGDGTPRYEGSLKGERFPVVHLPELRLWASPDLHFSGSPSQVAVRGRIDVPEALIQPRDNKGVVRPSRDALVIDRPRRAPGGDHLALDAVLTVALEEKVQVKALGLTGRLRGEAVLKADSLENIRLNGQVAMSDGSYERYGVNLRISRCLAVFKDEPIERGSLDILASKTIQDGNRGDVEAGVMITGSVSNPHVRLYGRPAMSDRDVISYLVVGRSYREDAGGGQKEQMAQWAAAVLAGSSSSSLTRQIQDRLGIDRIGIESDSTGEISRSLITVGKFLSPDLYVSFGRSLFGEDYYISTRYSFLKNWQIESRVGMQSGADIYYRIEFD